MSEEPVKLALDVQSSVSVEECELLAERCRGKIVLEIGCGEGRLTIALASVAQRVHSMDDHGGDNPFGNTVDACIKNLKRYRALDRAVIHIGAMDKVILALDRSIFHVVILNGTKAVRVMVNNQGLIDGMLKKGIVELYAHTANDQDAPALARYEQKSVTPRLTQLKLKAMKEAVA